MVPAPAREAAAPCLALQVDLACDRLYRRHHAVLVAFAHRRGCDEHEAWDVVQELFLRLFRRGMIATLGAWGEEAQRAWLLRTLRWVICNQHRERTRLKRGRGHAHESLDHLLDGGVDIPGRDTPATEHDRRWAVAVMQRGIDRLRAGMRPEAWDGFELNLWDEAAPRTPAARVANHRARVRLREMILREGTQLSLFQAAAGLAS